MKLLFVHDHPFYRDINQIVYTGGSFPKNLWSNYLMNFDEVIVYGRNSKSLKSKNGESSSPNVSFHLTDNYSSVLSLIKNKRGIENELENLINNVDVVLVRLPSILGVIAGLIALKNKKKIWVEQVGNAKEAMLNHGSILGKLLAPFLHQFNKKLAKSAHFISYVTEKKLQRDYPCNEKALQVSLSDVIIKKIFTNDEIDSKSRFFSSVFKIGVIGGFDAKYKGYDVLLKSIDKLPSDVKTNIELYFIGKGKSQWVKDLARRLNLLSNIKFIGPLQAGEEVNKLLSELSLYVQPSLTEGMPRALLEAMAMGCPSLGSDVGGIPDILNTKNIHQAGDYVKLSEQIKYYYDVRVELLKESNISLNKIEPYLHEKINKRRVDFYCKMNKCINEK